MVGASVRSRIAAEDEFIRGGAEGRLRAVAATALADPDRPLALQFTAFASKLDHELAERRPICSSPDLTISCLLADRAAAIDFLAVPRGLTEAEPSRTLALELRVPAVDRLTLPSVRNGSGWRRFGSIPGLEAGCARCCESARAGRRRA